MPDNPSNADIMEVVSQHTKDDQAYQRATDKSLQAIHKNMVKKEDVADAVGTAIANYFEDKGKLTFKTIVATGILLGALGVIFTFVKGAAAWFGITYIR